MSLFWLNSDSLAREHDHSMKLSILVPTLFPDKAHQAIDALRPQLAGIAHEFVVVSPHEMAGPAIVYVAETERRGPTAAHHAALARARGEIVLVAADDIRFAPTAIAETLANFADPQRPFPMAVTYPRIVLGQVVAHVFCGRVTPSFFAIGREDVDAAGGWIDLRFVAGYGDCDLGFRIIENGGKVRLLQSPFLEHLDPAAVAPTKFNRAQLEKDFRYFLEKWGRCVDPAWGTDEYGMNFMVPVKFLPLVTNEPASMVVDGPDAIRDLRILARLWESSCRSGSDMPVEVAANALKYLRWSSAAGATPPMVVVRNRLHAVMVQPTRAPSAP